MTDWHVFCSFSYYRWILCTRSNETETLAPCKSPWYCHDAGLIDLEVLCLTSQGFRVNVSPSTRTLGREVQRMVCKRLSCNQGSKLVLHHVERRWKKLMPNKTLQQQGIASAPFPAPVYPQLFVMPGSISKARSPSSALSSLQDLRTSKVLLRMRVHWRKSTLPFGKLLRYLPQTLQTLSFPTEFNQSLKRVTLPSSLQSLSFWEGFNQSLDHVIPCDLAKWLSRLEFWGAVDGERLSCNQGSKFVLHHVERRWKKLMPNKTLQQQGIASAPFPAPVYPQLFMMPGSISKACSPSSALSSLQDLRTSKVLLRMRVHWRKSTLPFGKLLRYLPQTLQTLSFPTEFNQSLKRVTLPSSLQSLSFWEGFNQSLDHVIPCDLAKWLSRLEFWGAVDGERLSCNQGSKFVLHHLERRWKKLMPNKTLQQQGIASAPFPAPVYPQLFMMPGSISKACSPSSALSSLQDLGTSKVLLRMRVHWRKSTLPFGKLLRYLPQTLQTLSFPTEFIQSLKCVTLPSSLQSLSFGKRFNQSLDHVIPCDLAKWLSRLEFWGAVVLQSGFQVRPASRGKKVKEAHAEQNFATARHSKCTLSCTRIPTTVYDAWLYIQGLLPFQCTLIPARPWNFESLAEDESALTKINFAIWQTIALPSSNTSDLEFSYGIYPELEACDPAKQPSIFKFWEEIQPKLGPCDLTK